MGKLTSEQIARAALALRAAPRNTVWIDGVEYVVLLGGNACQCCLVYEGTESLQSVPLRLCMGCVPRVRAELKRLVRRDQQEKQRQPRPIRPE